MIKIYCNRKQTNKNPNKRKLTHPTFPPLLATIDFPREEVRQSWGNKVWFMIYSII